MEGVNTRRIRGAAAVSPPELLDDSVLHNETIVSTDLQMLMAEVRQFREELRATRLQMEMLNGTMVGLVLRIDEFDQTIDKLQVRVGGLESRLADRNAFASRDDSLVHIVEQLKGDINDRDQEMLCNDIEVSCIPEEKGENLVHIITVLGMKLGVKLSEQELVSASRVGRIHESSESVPTPPRPRHIVVRFCRRALKDQLLTAARVRRGITTEDSGLPAPHRRFYVNERLTKVNRQLFGRARDLGTRLGWRFIWTRDGRIYARRHQGVDSPRLRIRTEGDLRRVFWPDAVSASL
ncbi:Zinc finger DNA binding protein [Operophtera brumata]|uniref:Zinc finger DNA binding protein n=1 Tax=Operophtera brumata TaxID=104452 RepID=A0A0L7K2H2_OPEBR|nr:Zinc finger DNA binding protein [Operophtera brumata]